MNADSKPKRRWMPIVLVVSLALNLLIIGVAVGTVLRLKGGDHAKAPPGFGPALYRALPKDDRKAMRSELGDLHKKGSKGRTQDFEAMSQALRAVPFDPNAVETLLQQQAQATANLQGALQAQWLIRVTAMSDEERQAYADRLQDVVKRGPHKHKKKD
ncbi:MULTISPECIES: periplasmic heavy metal sensor [unclassified Ruegeria]|uniref:periplasmic heavy metal sensor n=1 Tax=unclassified Ruegeria TaxID=2625375 RepID=UPI0014882E33|nr:MULTISPECIES: periplasmic heavy metal sensor [unclassified Ruegeria]NOE34637.1 periplasmic heavy metal sensor [Ruegeria sp. HKCCD7318]